MHTWGWQLSTSVNYQPVCLGKPSLLKVRGDGLNRQYRSQQADDAEDAMSLKRFRVPVSRAPERGDRPWMEGNASAGDLVGRQTHEHPIP